MQKKITIIIFILLFGAVSYYLISQYLDSQNASISENQENSNNESILNDEENQEDLPEINLASQTVTLEDGTDTEFQIAEPFEINTAAEGLGKARFMSRSPDGRIFIPDLVDYNLSHQGKIYILDDFNEETKEFETKGTYLSGLRGPNSVAFHTDENGDQWIYIALTAELIRYPYNAGDNSPSGEAEVITTFPNDQVPGQASVVWHITRTIKFRNDRLFVSVGSGCDSCEQPEGEYRGMIYSMNPDGSNREVYADGLRNAVGFTWANDEIYATENGVDDLGPSAPDGLMYRLEKGENYGWPYCYESNGEVLPDETSNWPTDYDCSQAPKSFASFAAHTAPLGVEYFENAHPVIDNSFLVALHGSFEPQIKNGYKIVRVSEDGEVEDFMTGFQNENGDRFGRPVHFLQKDRNSLFFSDDMSGRIYHISAE